jgi:hypothetical protein
VTTARSVDFFADSGQYRLTCKREKHHHFRQFLFNLFRTVFEPARDLHIAMLVNAHVKPTAISSARGKEQIRAPSKIRAKKFHASNSLKRAIFE